MLDFMQKECHKRVFGFVAKRLTSKKNQTYLWFEYIPFVVQVQSTAFAFKTARHLESVPEASWMSLFLACPTQTSDNKEIGFTDQVSWESKGTSPHATPPPHWK